MKNVKHLGPFWPVHLSIELFGTVMENLPFGHWSIWRQLTVGKKWTNTRYLTLDRLSWQLSCDSILQGGFSSSHFFLGGCYSALDFHLAIRNPKYQEISNTFAYLKTPKTIRQPQTPGYPRNTRQSSLNRSCQYESPGWKLFTEK